MVNYGRCKKLAEEIVGLTLLEAVELKNILKDEYNMNYIVNRGYKRSSR